MSLLKVRQKTPLLPQLSPESQARKFRPARRIGLKSARRLAGTTHTFCSLLCACIPRALLIVWFLGAISGLVICYQARVEVSFGCTKTVCLVTNGTQPIGFAPSSIEFPRSRLISVNAVHCDNGVIQHAKYTSKNGRRSRVLATGHRTYVIKYADNDGKTQIGFMSNYELDRDHTHLQVKHLRRRLSDGIPFQVSESRSFSGSGAALFAASLSLFLATAIFTYAL